MDWKETGLIRPSEIYGVDSKQSIKEVLKAHGQCIHAFRVPLCGELFLGAPTRGQQYPSAYYTLYQDISGVHVSAPRLILTIM